MAEINAADLPLVPDGDFSASDSFLLINNGNLQLLTRNQFEDWMLLNVQGEKGDQGVQGQAGTDGISATHSWTGTILNITSASGTSSSDLKGADGVNGTDGTNGTNGNNGTNGWSPVFSIANRSDDRVLQVSSWVGGSGTIPTSGQYVGASGLVSNINDAVNIRGQNGTDAIAVVSATFNNDGTLTLTFSDATSLISNTLTKSMIGLGNVDNTSDSNKAISTATQTALDLKVDISDLENDVRSTPLTGLSLSTSTGVVSTDTILESIGKLQAQFDNKYNEAGQVKINYTGLSLTSFTANTYKTFDINAATPTVVSSPTTEYPHSTPNSYSGVFDSSRGTTPTGRLIENPIGGQLHGWRIQGGWSGKSISTGVDLFYLRIRNPISGFNLVTSIPVSADSASGSFFEELITIADTESIPSPNGYILDVASTATDGGLTIQIDTITRISYAKESN